MTEIIHSYEDQMEQRHGKPKDTWKKVFYRSSSPKHVIDFHNDSFPDMKIMDGPLNLVVREQPKSPEYEQRLITYETPPTTPPRFPGDTTNLRLIAKLMDKTRPLSYGFMSLGSLDHKSLYSVQRLNDALTDSKEQLESDDEPLNLHRSTPKKVPPCGYGETDCSGDGSTFSEDSGVNVCPDCGKRYSTSSNLARHRQTHRSLADKKARQCPHCDKVYVSMPAYSMHVRTHDQGCQCPYCGKRFSRPWLLQGHIRTHTGERPFKCPVCSKAFADKSNLRAHIQTHSNTKPYVCGRCGKAFALKSYLYKHEESSCMRLQRLVMKKSLVKLQD